MGNIWPPEGGAATRDEYGLLMDMLNVSVSKHKLDEDFTLVWANAHYYEFIGYPKDEYERLYHNSPREYFKENPEDLASIALHVAEALEQGQTGYECVAQMHVKGNRTIWVKFTATFLDEYVDGCQLSYTTMTDITDIVVARETLSAQKKQLERANAELERLAFVDPVTEGFNQTKFDLMARDAIDAGLLGEYALVALDLKKFKLLNDAHGTEAGDRVLRYVYKCLRALIDEGEYVARLNADSFNLLLRTGDTNVLVARVNDMVQDINKFNENADRPYYLSFTVGVYPIDDKKLPMTIVRDRANVARNSGKSEVNACHFTYALYSDTDRQRLLLEQDMENRMRSALRHGEFVSYLQPKQALSDGSIGGAEALVRWVDPVRGLIPPDEFVPFFERNGFIIDVDLAVFEQVCVLLASWIKQGRTPVPISVNMSRAHMYEPDFLTPYERIRKRYNVPPELLEIELTETLVFDDPEAFMSVIGALHKHGYRCSLDDFGSGYSSLNVLKDMDIDVMKLDRAFFSAGDATSLRDWDVVESIIGLAKKLDLETVAEGVEEPSQAERLRKVDCDLLQGYVFSRPLPIPEFEKLLFGE